MQVVQHKVPQDLMQAMVQIRLFQAEELQLELQSVAVAVVLEVPQVVLVDRVAVAVLTRQLVAPEQ